MKRVTRKLGLCYRNCAVIAAAAGILLWSGACGQPETGETSTGEISVRKEETGESTPGETGSAKGAESSAPESSPVDEDLVFEDREMVEEGLLDLCREYQSVVESYEEDTFFSPAAGEEAKELARLLEGHYEVAGRDGGGKRYYLAARRKDAPVYEDFHDLSVGFMDDDSGRGSQIGYYDEEMKEKLLYKIPGYSVHFFGEKQQDSSLDLLCLIPEEALEDQAFICAFEEEGRLLLDFMKKHRGLSFYEEGESGIDFLYQDKETIEFWSEPYPCWIGFDQKDCEKLKELLEGNEEESGQMIFENPQEALKEARQQNLSVRTTGAGFYLEGKRYELLGGRECPGYVLSYEEGQEGEVVKLEQNQPVYSYILDRIKDVTGRDYGNFTEDWFSVPLTSASLEFPQMEAGVHEDPVFFTGFQIIEDPEKLQQLSGLLEKAIQGEEVLSKCPYVGVLNLTREDGETLEMFVAADSCDSVTYEGRIGFEYGNQQELAKIFTEAME